MLRQPLQKLLCYRPPSYFSIHFSFRTSLRGSTLSQWCWNQTNTVRSPQDSQYPFTRPTTPLQKIKRSRLTTSTHFFFSKPPYYLEICQHSITFHLCYMDTRPLLRPSKPSLFIRQPMTTPTDKAKSVSLAEQPHTLSSPPTPVPSDKEINYNLEI